LKKRLDKLDDWSYIIHSMARTRQNEEIRKRLLEVGVSMFIDQGYHGTGIQEVVDMAGIPKGSFYNYFKSKEDFGSKTVINFSEQFKEFLVSIAKDSEKDAYSAINRFFNDLIDTFERKDCKEGCLIGNFAAEISDRSELSRETMSKCMNEWRDILGVVLHRAQGQGKIRDDIQANELADFLLNSVEGSLLRMKVETNSRPLRQCKEMFLNYVMKP